MNANQLLSRALAFWGNPTLGSRSRAALLGFAQVALADATQQWKQDQYPVLTLNALRMLVAICPDFQTC
jgi:hypothetical protein